MKNRSKTLARTLITVVLAFAVVGSASAGAVRRGGDKSKSSTPREARTERERPQTERVDRSRSNTQPAERERGREVERNRRTPDATPSYKRDDSRNRNQDTNRNDQSYRPNSDTRDSDRNRTTRDLNRRRPDATPTSKRDDDRNRYQDRNKSDQNSYRPDRNTGDSDRNRNTRDFDRDRDRNRRDSDRVRDTREFDRVRERDQKRYDHPRSYKPPRYQGGYYYYDHVSRYYNRPFRYGYWIFDPIPSYSLRSSYYHYGYFPYIPNVRVIIIRRPAVHYVEVPLVIKDGRYYDTDYYLDGARTSSIGYILDDIARAWTRSDADAILGHVRDDVRIDVLLDGEYNYSLSADDYREMTRDAVAGIRTVDFDWYSIKSRGDDKIIARARHDFYSGSGDRRTVYVSYQLERVYGDWVITEVGTSLRRQ